MARTRTHTVHSTRTYVYTLHARALATSKLLSRSVRFAIFSLSRERLRHRSPVTKTGPPYRMFVCVHIYTSIHAYILRDCFCNASVFRPGPSRRELKKYPAGYLNRTLFVYRPWAFRAIKSIRNRFVNSSPRKPPIATSATACRLYYYYVLYHCIIILFYCNADRFQRIIYCPIENHHGIQLLLSNNVIIILYKNSTLRVNILTVAITSTG